MNLGTRFYFISLFYLLTLSLSLPNPPHRVNSHRLPNQKFHPDLERGKGLRCGRCNRWMLLGTKEIGWPEEGEGKAVSAEIASDTNPAPATPA